MIRALGTSSLALAALLSFSTAFADVKPVLESKILPGGTTRMLLTNGRVESVKHLNAKCGPLETCVNVTQIEISFGLGCVDDVVAAGVPSVNVKSNKIILDVTAFMLINKQSETARCIVQNRKVATFYVKSELTKVAPTDVSVNYQTTLAPIR